MKSDRMWAGVLLKRKLTVQLPLRKHRGMPSNHGIRARHICKPRSMGNVNTSSRKAEAESWSLDFISNFPGWLLAWSGLLCFGVEQECKGLTGAILYVCVPPPAGKGEVSMP